MIDPNLYSQRNKQEVDIFSYEPLPNKLIRQIQYIIEDFFDQNEIDGDAREMFWYDVNYVLTRLHGDDDENFREGKSSQVIAYFSNTDIEKALDAVELCFRIIWKFGAFLDQKQVYYSFEDDVTNKAIDSLNFVFRLNGMGYKFEFPFIIKANNEVLHQEIVKPTLSFLQQQRFQNINEEYLKAHEHYRHNRNQECLNECLKAFETTMKIICTIKRWDFDAVNDTSSKLVNILYAKQFVPEYLQANFSALRSMLISGIPPIRNRNSGHGQGPKKIVVKDDIASYCLNLTGSTIKFLLELL